MAITEKHKCTYQDYLNTPDDTRYELIEGNLILIPPVPRPSIKESHEN